MYGALQRRGFTTRVTTPGVGQVRVEDNVRVEIFRGVGVIMEGPGL